MTLTLERDRTGIQRFDILGVKVSAIDMPMAVNVISEWIDARSRNYVCVTGVHGVMESQHDAALLNIHNRAGMVTPDGMPLVWLARARGLKSVERVYGPDLILACSGHAVSRGWRFFFYGGADGVAELLARRLRALYPGLQVVGSYSPPFRNLTDEEDAEVIARINASAPDIVWVGLGTPRQEQWMAAHVGRLNAAVLVGVGAAFDFHAGIKRQAPRWMQRTGMEWMFRLLSEPRRLLRRYIVNNPAFVVRISFEFIRSMRNFRAPS